MTPKEIKYLIQLLTELAAWDPIHNVTQRKKRFIPLFASIGAAIGSIVNAGQIKKIKKNIAILQEATNLQDQQIMELARYTDLTAARVRLHDTQIYRLQYGLLVVEDGIRKMTDVSNFQIYTSYHVTIAQTILSRLQTGSVGIENNIDKIFEYLRIMSNHKATSAVISPVALRRLLLKIEDRMHANPRLRLPYDPSLVISVRIDTIGKIELNPSFVLSSDNTNCKNDIQLFHQLFDELSVNGDYH